MTITNRLMDNLKAGKTSVGCVITMSDLIVSELVGDCGMDFVWIDAEHAPHTIQDVQRHLIALRGTGCAGLVRVRADEPMLIKPYLDLAPDGIIVPMVNTPEQAEAAVAACRYPPSREALRRTCPPTGIRGCGVRRAVRYGAEDFFDYVKIGPYRRSYGPLNSPTTNQRMFKLQRGKGRDSAEDITERFWHHGIDPNASK